VINHVGQINFKKIKRITPSQFYSMKNCAYKSLLAEAFDKKPLLPLSPNAYFGTVLHKMLELIAKGVVKNEGDFNTLFDEQIKTVEDNLQASGYIFFVPLQKTVKDFGLKKILLKKHFRTVSEESVKSSTVKFYSEKWYESKDKLLAGKIDLVVEAGNETEIIDFKTGAITEDVLDDAGEIFSEVKEEYKEQLKLYAYLYFENTGKFPDSLILLDLAKKRFTIPFSHDECAYIYTEAKSLLIKVNDSINTQTFMADPTESNCRYCLYRPACSFFHGKLPSGLPVNDAIGLVTDVKRYLNGNVSVFLENGNQKVSVTSLPGEMYEVLNVHKGKPISVYNLRKEALEGVFSFTKTTTMYE
jgi:CRISPR/Cas system-associated exonuclease Cas4 (RecB family)